MTSTIIRALRIFTVRALPTLLANALALNAFSMHAAANWANLVQALLRLRLSEKPEWGHTPAWSTLALAHLAKTVTIALHSHFEEASTMLPLTHLSEEGVDTVALGKFCVALSVAGAKPTFTTNHTA